MQSLVCNLLVITYKPLSVLALVHNIDIYSLQELLLFLSQFLF